MQLCGDNYVVQCTSAFELKKKGAPLVQFQYQGKVHQMLFVVTVHATNKMNDFEFFLGRTLGQWLWLWNCHCYHKTLKANLWVSWDDVVAQFRVCQDRNACIQKDFVSMRSSQSFHIRKNKVKWHSWDKIFRFAGLLQFRVHLLITVSERENSLYWKSVPKRYSEYVIHIRNNTQYICFC